jgi:hypothetical protein
MAFEFNFCTVIDYAVQIIGQLLQEFRAFHWLPSPGSSVGLPSALPRF